MQRKKENWVWIPEWSAADKDVPALILFRRRIRILSKPKRAEIRISADSRYKLYLDGKMVEMGPSRGDGQIWYYDEIDLLPLLDEGEHVLAVQVLRYPTQHHKGNHGIFRTEHPGLFVKGAAEDYEGNRYCLDAGAEWKCKKDGGFCIVSEAEGFAPLQIFEKRQGQAGLAGWMQPGYDDRDWHTAEAYPFMSRAASPGNLHPRTIPFLYRRDRDFDEVMTAPQSGFQKQDWEAFLKGQKPLSIAAHSKEVVEISAGEEMTGYLHLCMRGGKGAGVRILQSESYVQQKRHHNGLPVKRQRDDWRNGHLEGFADFYRAAGYGAEKLEEEYEPFWFRTFRFIRLEIETEYEPLILTRFYYTETGYPLEVRTRVAASDPKMEGIWEISERSLRRCMHETYEDCPFYEQLQYAMDARLEILYTYAVSADDRLARKCMDDFKRSQRYDGLLNCSYPCYGPNIIPGFPVYYILMLYDHMMYFGDKELLEDHLPTVERILNFFHRRRTPEGYVMKLGGLNGVDAKWSFIDWTPEWDDTTGVPDAARHGPITMESLLYIMGLQRTSDLAAYLGRKELAAVCLKRAQAVQAAVRRYCTGKEGMLSDGPGVDLYSQHVQVFAVLTHTADPQQGKRNLEQTLLFPERYAQCSVAMAFYLFQALRETGLYTWTEKYWEIWKRMLEKGLTTCVEDEVGERSDCHAWGSLILYELPSVVLGVQPASPGYGSVKICPQPGHFKYAQGYVLTPKGFVTVSWSREDGGAVNYTAPEGLEVQIDTTALKIYEKEKRYKMQADMITTTFPNQKRATAERRLLFREDNGIEKQVINLYPEAEFQTFEGFGGAFTDSAGYVYAQMGEADKRTVISTYFGAGRMNYRLGRMHIDSCDFSAGQYEAMADKNDRKLESFSLDRTKKYIFPLLRDAEKELRGPVELMITPWSPPAFMKTNGQRSHGGKLKDGYGPFWADYICRYVTELREEGLNVCRLSIQNEPKAVQAWDSCIFSAEEERDFLKNDLYPAMEKNGLADVEIFIWDHNKERLYERACTVITEETRHMIAGLAFHWYSGDHFEALELVRRRFPDKKLILSEACIEYSIYDAKDYLANAQKYAHDIIGNLNAGMHAFYDWNLLLDGDGGPNHVQNLCDSPYMYDIEKHKLIEKNTLVYIWHFSHFIQPGAVRIGFSRYTADLEVTALRNPDGRLVSVIMNAGAQDRAACVRLNGMMAECVLPAQSISTIVI